MVQVMCGWCQPPRKLFDAVPLEDNSVRTTICEDCYKKMMSGAKIPSADVPKELGTCEITRVEEKGDLHVMCGDNFYKITTDGDVEEESEPNGLSEAEPETADGADGKIDFVAKAMESES